MLRSSEGRGICGEKSLEEFKTSMRMFTFIMSDHDILWKVSMDSLNAENGVAILMGLMCFSSILCCFAVMMDADWLHLRPAFHPCLGIGA